MTSAFNIFMLGDAWLPYQAFSKPVTGAQVSRFRPDLAEEPEVYPAAKVVIMGGKNATGVMQSIHRNMLLLTPPYGAGLPPQAEVKRDKRFPDWSTTDEKSIALIYLDGFTETELKYWNALVQGTNANTAGRIHTQKVNKMLPRLRAKEFTAR